MLNSLWRGEELSKRVWMTVRLRPGGREFMEEIEETHCGEQLLEYQGDIMGTRPPAPGWWEVFMQKPFCRVQIGAFRADLRWKQKSTDAVQENR